MAGWRKYRNSELGFEFRYPPSEDWEAQEILGQNPGMSLQNEHYLDQPPYIVVQVWFYPQWSDDFVIKNLRSIRVGKYVGGRRLVNHPQYGKSLETFFKLPHYAVDFLLTGKFRKDETKEFEKIVRTFKVLSEKS